MPRCIVAGQPQNGTVLPMLSLRRRVPKNETTMNRARGEVSFKKVVLRSVTLFMVLVGVGGGLLLLLVSNTDNGPVATVVPREAKPVLVRAPDRPDAYPENLPALDNVNLVEVKAEPGALLYQLASPGTPADVVAMIEAAFDANGWERNFITSTNRIIGAAIKGSVRVGVTVDGEDYTGTPKGWVTIRLMVPDTEGEDPSPLEPQEVPLDAIA